MTITANWVAARLKTRATITTVTLSTTDVDDMNGPLETTTTTDTWCRYWPTGTTETSGSDQRPRQRVDAVFAACDTVTNTSRVTLPIGTFDVEGPAEPWPDECGDLVGQVVHLVRAP